MRQRLGIAAALLGDPPALLFDEPVNGLDPEGIHWIRRLFKSLAAEGRTVFVSSHLMSEMALTAAHLIISGRGRLLADTPRGFVVGPRSDVRCARPAVPRSTCWPARRAVTAKRRRTTTRLDAAGDRRPSRAARGITLHGSPPAPRWRRFMELPDVNYRADLPADTRKAA
jgi:ABC-2 type transport system ATP-binding protein